MKFTYWKAIKEEMGDFSRPKTEHSAYFGLLMGPHTKLLWTICTIAIPTLLWWWLISLWDKKDYTGNNWILIMKIKTLIYITCFKSPVLEQCPDSAPTPSSILLGNFQFFLCVKFVSNLVLWEFQPSFMVVYNLTWLSLYFNSPSSVFYSCNIAMHLKPNILRKHLPEFHNAS